MVSVVNLPMLAGEGIERVSGSKSAHISWEGDSGEQCLTCAEGSSNSLLLKSADSRVEIQLVNRLGFILVTEKAWEMGEFLSCCSLRFKTRYPLCSSTLLTSLWSHPKRKNSSSYKRLTQRLAAVKLLCQQV